MRLLLLAVAFCFAVTVEAKTAVKDWTFLVYINGHNNLDSFGAKDINEMEKIGSTNKVNVVVQWASLKNKSTRRLLVIKDNDPSKVTSPAVQTLPQVDMGNPDSLVDFAKWGAENYPAQHYFIAVWNHGSGWHLERKGEEPNPMLDGISYDDVTGHFINTPQLGAAMDKIAAIFGHKVDIYGSDACLMAMPDVATQMKNSVSYFVGSEETEPGEGWPYDTLLASWNALPSASAEDVAKILTYEYVKSYSGGTQGSDDVTFSAFNLSEDVGTPFLKSIKDLGEKIAAMDPAKKKAVLEVVKKSQNFYYADYVDLGDFLKNLGSVMADEDLSTTISQVRAASSGYLVANATTPGYSRAQGISIWLPASKSSLNNYFSKYMDLEFHKITGWGTALKALHN